MRAHIALIPLMFAAGVAHAQGADDDAAIARGKQALEWAKGYSCPVLATPLSVSGLETAKDIARVRAENWNYASGRMQAMAEAISARRSIEAQVAVEGGKPSRSMQKSFEALDKSIAATSARTTSALAQWMLASWVEMSRLDAGIDLLGGGRHPLASYAADAQRLDQLAGAFGGALTPVVEKYRSCLAAMQGSLIEYNAAQINAAAGAARTPAALGRVLTSLEVVPSPLGTAGGELVASLRARHEALLAAQAQAEQRRQASASAELRAKLQRDANAARAVVARYISAINSGDLSTGIALLHDQVRLVSPRDSATGKQAVAARMRGAASDDQGVRPGAPQIDGNYQIFAPIRSSRGSGKMYFTVTGGKIDQIRLVQD